MKPRERGGTGEQDLFRSRLDQIIDMNCIRTAVSYPYGESQAEAGTERWGGEAPRLGAMEDTMTTEQKIVRA